MVISFTGGGISSAFPEKLPVILMLLYVIIAENGHFPTAPQLLPNSSAIAP
jgi:hypothetical protein